MEIIVRKKSGYAVFRIFSEQLIPGRNKSGIERFFRHEEV